MNTKRVTVDGARLWQRHEDMAQIGATPAGGVNRQALSIEDSEARRLILDWSDARNYQAATDAIGNLYISRTGRRLDLPPVLTGSHLDSQPAGGRYDGTYGVLAGFEVLEALDDRRIVTDRTITLVAWMNEEGSRFAPVTMGSGVFAGALSLASVLATSDTAGTSVAEALASLEETQSALLPQVAVPFPVAAYVEAHIEQGPILERLGKRIGAVSGIQGLRWFEITVQGRTAHAGTTPHADRQDALVAAIDLIGDLRQRSQYGGEQVRFTIGRMIVGPGSPNTVPNSVVFTIDLRHPDRRVLEEISQSIATACQHPRGACTIALREMLNSPPVTFDPRVVKSVRLAAADRGYPWLDLVSGATHDAKHLANLCPTGMIFIPCRDGVSHHEAESITREDATAGAQILADIVLELAMTAD